MKPLFVNKVKITGVIIASVILLSALGFYYFSGVGPSTHRDTREDILSGPGHLPEKNYSARTTNKKAGLSLEDRLVAELQEFYGKTISEKSTQVLLLKIKNFLSGLYPEDGDLKFYAILKRAFPDLADEIMETLEKMEHYNRFVDENEQMLSQMNELEKQGTLWKKRRELFGDEAEDVWSEEVLAYEKRKQDMRDAIRLLDGSSDTTIDEKLAVYKSSLNQAYEDSPEAYILDNTDMLAKVFFAIDSVQEELKQLEPDQRTQEINRIRKEMGYSLSQIKELQALDDHRDRRWENGLAYMDERERIAGEFEGPQREEQLKVLREKYFKHEAKTIELEEKDGFFRYERQRIYGRN